MMNSNNKSTSSNINIKWDPHDDRPFVKDLLHEHAKAIADVRKNILSDQAIIEKPLLWDPKRYDDLWILRFLLSHKGKVKSASSAALRTIQFREEFKLNQAGDLRHIIRNFGGVERKEGQAEIPSYSVWNTACGDHAFIATQPDPNRGLLIYMDIGKLDMPQLYGKMTKEETKMTRIYQNEAHYQVSDEVTRRTGRLTKISLIFDYATFSLSQLSRKFSNRDAEISKELEDYFPQLISSIYIANAPGWAISMWAIARKILPKRLLEKFDLVPTNTASQKVYPPILRHISETNLPKRFGGQNKEWPLPSVSELLAASKAN